MSGVDLDDPKPMSRRARWWAGYGLLAAVNGVAALGAFLQGNWEMGVTNTLVAGILVVDRASMRSWFHVGWLAGYMAGSQETDAARNGVLPASLLRAVATGRPQPEPWDTRPPQGTTPKP